MNRRAYLALLRKNCRLLLWNIRLRRTISRLHALRLEELKAGVRVPVTSRQLAIVPNKKENL